MRNRRHPDASRRVAQRLAKEHRKQAGMYDTPTSDMYGECQELLQMFGLPYIIAPVEAEAQCAWLDSNGLVDGVVTDDNDVFLFGGEHVYRCGASLTHAQPSLLCTQGGAVSSSTSARSAGGAPPSMFVHLMTGAGRLQSFVACRHIFADKQYVEEYRARDFQSELGLDRHKLIHLALLLGSDYTEGISGIGIVNAVRRSSLPQPS